MTNQKYALPTDKPKRNAQIAMAVIAAVICMCLVSLAIDGLGTGFESDGITQTSDRIAVVNAVRRDDSVTFRLATGEERTVGLTGLVVRSDGNDMLYDGVVTETGEAVTVVEAGDSLSTQINGVD